jgi:ribonucleoside-diphosphate reductase beta chain
MGIFDKSKHIDPKYQHLDKYVKKMYKGFWTPAKYEKNIHDIDVPHFFNEMNEVDQEFIRRAIMAVALVEDKVKVYWSTLVLDIPQTIIGDVGGIFGLSEVTHRRSYHSLAEELKIDTENLEQHPALADRVKYLKKYVDKDPKIIGKKRLLKKLLLFTSLVEKGSLFTQFYGLMSYAKSNRGLKTISALQQSTATEENMHYSFGIDLINIIKDEYPQLWDDYLIELVQKSVKMAFDSELRLIDWFFEKGVPEHLSKEEMVNFLKYNFNQICKDLQIEDKISFKYDEKIYREQNEWFTVKVIAPTDPDFFDNAVGGYSHEEKEIDVENFKFN